MRIILCKGQIYGPISGSDETLVTYASQLQKAGHHVSVLLMYLHAEEDQYYQRLLEAGVPVSWIASNLAHTSMGAGRKLAYKMFNTFPGSKQFIRRRSLRLVTRLATRYSRQCREFMEKQKADLIHVMTPDPSAMVMIQAGHDAGIPVIYQELGIPYHPPDFESYYEQFTSVLPLCAEIAALSPKLIEHCREKLPDPRALSILPIMSDEFVNGRKPHQPAPGKITFGFAARMEELKGPMVLMEAFGVAYQQCRDICLNIAGDGSQRQKIAARAKALDVASRYRYHGVYTHPEECRAFMESLDVFVMPSFTEGTPNSIVEAMACGKPIIASEVGGIPDMIGEESGILVPAGDKRALTEAMLRLALDEGLRKRMGAAAKERYQRLFSPAVVVPLMLETYHRITNNGSASTLTPGAHHPWANNSASAKAAQS
ncbi:MAG TPA: glycosyltransferase [Pyrinomonadaceae bacterium]|nr:glycosyltransferase [Pyrinomonadaceae bacterium]